MNLTTARRLAKFIALSMSPHCELDTVAIVGSIRREKPEVKDLEIIASPITQSQPSLLEDTPARVRSDALLQWAMREKTQNVITWVKAGRGTLEKGGLEPVERLDVDGKYWRGKVCAEGSEPVMLDLFLPVPQGYWPQFVIRTGSADFSEALVTHAKRIGYRFAGGLLYDRAGLVVECKREGDVFEALGLAWVEPKDRRDKYDMHGIA